MSSKRNTKATLDERLKRLGKPPLENIEFAGERIWKVLCSADTSERRQRTQLTNLTDVEPVKFPSFRLPVLAVAATLLLLVGMSSVLVRSIVMREGGVRAVVLEGALSRIAGEKASPLQIGQRIGPGELIRCIGDKGAVIALADNSRVEMRSESEFQLERAEDGVRIHLNRGSVIVNAAKQRDGHLYVQTKDVTVSVVGTVFLVNAEEEGSRVAVIQGEVQVFEGSTQKELRAGEQVTQGDVHIRQGQTLHELLPGEQMSTGPSKVSVPVAEEIAWSRSAESHLALMQRATTESSRLRFEVASVKEHDPADRTPGITGFRPGGRFIATNATLGQLIRAAYNVRPDQVSGGPGWINSGGERYDVEALAPQGSFPGRQPDRVLVDKIRLMLQALLADRFALSIQREIKELPVYNLTVARNGGKLQKSDRDCDAAPSACHGFVGGRGRGLTAQGMDMNDLADALSFWTDRPVQDRTGIDGIFDFFIPPWIDPTQAPSQRIPDGNEPSPDPSGPDLFTSLQDSIGLRLEARKGPVELLLIESATRPPPN